LEHELRELRARVIPNITIRGQMVDYRVDTSHGVRESVTTLRTLDGSVYTFDIVTLGPPAIGDTAIFMMERCGP